MGGGTVKAQYAVTSNPETTKFLYTRSLTKFFTIYNEVSFFLARNLNSDINAFSSSFISPSFESLSTTGYTCACFNGNQSMLYIVNANEDLIEYNIALDTVTNKGKVGVSNVIDCYFDGIKNAIIVVRSDFDMK